MEQKSKVKWETSKSSVSTISAKIDAKSTDKLIYSGDPGGKGDPFKNYRILKQACLEFTWIAMGMYSEIIGPTLPDLRNKLDVNYEEISRAILCKSVGMMCGSVIGGFLFEWLRTYTHHLMFFGNILAAVGIGMVPWCPNLPLTGVAFTIVGTAMGLINIGGNVMVLDLWRAKAASPLSLLHFGFGVGGIVVPQIAHPFLSPRPETVSDIGLSNSSMENATGAKANKWAPAASVPLTSSFEMAYMIVSGITFLFSLEWLYYLIKGTPAGLIHERPKPTNLCDLMSPGSCTSGNVKYGVAIFVCLFIYFFQAVGGEGAASKFLYTSVMDGELAFSHTTAAMLMSAFWLSHLTGRFMGFVVARCVSVRAMIISDCLGCLISSMILAFYGNKERVVLWVFVCVSALFLSLANPNGMAWANLHLHMNSMGVMISVLGAGCGGAVYDYLTGYLFELWGPSSLFYVLVGHGFFICLVYTAMELVFMACGGQSVAKDLFSDIITTTKNLNNNNRQRLKKE